MDEREDYSKPEAKKQHRGSVLLLAALSCAVIVLLGMLAFIGLFVFAYVHRHG